MLIFDLTRFLIRRKKFWLVPVVLCLVLLGGVMVALEGTAVAPLVYTIF